MNQKLFTVEDKFGIKQRNGLAVVGAYQPVILKFKLRDEIVLVCPDNSKISAEIADSEIIQTVSGIKRISILLENFDKKDVPIGTKVFLK